MTEPDPATVAAIASYLRNLAAKMDQRLSGLGVLFGGYAATLALRKAADAIERGEPFR